MGESPQKPVPLRLTWSVEEFINEYCRDMELDGVSVVSSAQVPAGTIVDLTVEFAPQKLFRSLTQVVLPQTPVPGRIALKFVNLHQAFRAWLDARLAERSKKITPTNTHQLQKAISGDKLAGASEVLSTGASNEPTLGIDLGTCNSAACYVKDGKPIIIDLRDENDTRSNVHSIPSVVAFEEDGRECVGEPALRDIMRNPRRTIFGAKRFIGRTYDSPAVQNMLSRFPYKIVRAPNGRVAVDINGRPLQLAAVSARILSAIRQRAERQLGISFQHAIITVPAYYNDNQREAVVQAGRLAGLTVQRILNEPTAAAIAYSLTQTQPRKLLVYDLGGGTFDVSIMAVERQSLTVLATAGDTFLGGEDFDEAIVKLVSDQFTRKTGKHLSQNSAAMAPLKQQAEQAKRRLSTRDKAMILLKDAQLADRSTAKIEMEVTRAQIEKLVDPLIGRTLKICDMAIKEAGIDKEQLGDVILVGGQTQMPYVKQRVREHFGMAPRCDLNPDEVVALGAGLLAHGLGAAAELKDVLSMSIGVAVAGRMKVLIPRNTQVPCVRKVNMSVTLEEFAKYELDVWQGDSAELHQNEHLGTLKLDAISPGSANPVPLRIEFVLTADCLLKVRIVHAKTEETQQVLLSTRDSA